MSGKLEDKVAVVTGGAGGIGLATAKLFAAEGAQVVIFDIDAEAAARAMESINEKHAVAKQIVDVSDASQVEFAIREVVSTRGRIDILVNVAGGSGRRWGDGPTDSMHHRGLE